MKSILRITSIAILCVMLVAMLASCGAMRLSGTYSADVLGLAKAVYTFDGNEVTVTYDIYGYQTTAVGEYEIDEEAGVIILTFDNADDQDEFGGAMDFSYGEENGVEYIKMDGIKYTKE